MPLPEAKRRYQPSGEALAALDLCERLGAAPAESLQRLAAVEAELAKAKAELELAATGPRASAKLVTLLPVAVLLGAQLLGMRVFNQLSPLACAAICLGALLLFAGRRWSSRILAKAQPEASDPGAALDSFAAAMNAGLPQSAALIEVEKSFGSQPGLLAITTEAAQTGMAVTRLARAEADRLRLQWRVESERRIHEAGVRLMWPLGVAVLPAFVLIAVVPLAIAMLRGN